MNQKTTPPPRASHRPKNMKDLKNENYQVQKKEIEEDTRRCLDLLGSWMGRINITKMSISYL